MNLRQAFKKHKCDKALHNYDQIYNEVIKDGDSILEVGVFKGASTAAFLDTYPSSTLFALDTFERIARNELPVLNNPRVVVVEGESQKVELESDFDIIIDDGCHSHKCQLETFKNLFPHLKKGGHYFIEDVWPFDKMTEKGKNHPWLFGKDDYSDEWYEKLLEAIKPYDRQFHDFRRATNKVDSYMIEIIK